MLRVRQTPGRRGGRHRPPQPDEVKVKVAATAICHSDLHDAKGDFGGGLPFVGGHETAGYVEEVGSAVACVAPGDHVIVSLPRVVRRLLLLHQGDALLLRDQGHVRRQRDPDEHQGRGGHPEGARGRFCGVCPGPRVSAREDRRRLPHGRRLLARVWGDDRLWCRGQSHEGAAAFQRRRHRDRGRRAERRPGRGRLWSQSHHRGRYRGFEADKGSGVGATHG